MPTYEYECKKCGHVFDVFQSIKASPLKKAKCEECGTQRPVQRRIGTGAALLFKGGGFYLTDYRSDSYKKSAESEKGGGEAKKTDKPDTSSAAGKSADATAETSKPAEKKATKSKKSE